MNLGENILNQRKKKGITQEQLAEALGVTRQTISNWELGETSPSPTQLKLLSNYLQMSIDELLNNQEFIPKTSNKKTYGYEYISKRKIKGIPLLHIHIGLGHGIKKAKGIIAIGNIAQGVIALGGISIGLFTLGGISLGLLSLGGLVIGLLLALGGFALGSIAIGGIAIGYLAIGGFALGIYAVGGLALAKNVAVGDYAIGYLAIGNHPKGAVTLMQSKVASLEIQSIILKHFPNTWEIIVWILSTLTF